MSQSWKNLEFDLTASGAPAAVDGLSVGRGRAQPRLWTAVHSPRAQPGALCPLLLSPFAAEAVAGDVFEIKLLMSWLKNLNLVLISFSMEMKRTKNILL